MEWNFRSSSGYELAGNEIFLRHGSSGDWGGFCWSAVWVEWSAMKGMFITWESILGNPRYFSYFPCDSLSIMNEVEVVRIVGSSSAKKNENLLASVKSMLDDSLNELKRSQGDTADSHLKGSLTSRITSKIKVTKVDADLTLSPWRHWRGEKGKLLLKRQKHILLAEKSNFGWSLIWEYKRKDLADHSDDETKIYQSISQSAYPS